MIISLICYQLLIRLLTCYLKERDLYGLWKYLDARAAVFEYVLVAAHSGDDDDHFEKSFIIHDLYIFIY
jgi:hypothetical protein